MPIAPVRKCADSGAGDPSLLSARSRAAGQRVGPKSARRTADQPQTGMRPGCFQFAVGQSGRRRLRSAATRVTKRPRKERQRARASFAHLRSGPIRARSHAARMERAASSGNSAEAPVRQFDGELGFGQTASASLSSVARRRRQPERDVRVLLTRTPGTRVGEDPEGDFRAAPECGCSRKPLTRP